MVYCTLAEAWGDNFNASKPKRRRKRRKNTIKNVSIYDPELDETVVLNGKYSNKNQFTRDVHSHLTQQPRVKHVNVSIGDNHVEYLNENNQSNQNNQTLEEQFEENFDKTNNITGLPQYQITDNEPEYADLDTTTASNVQFDNNTQIVPFEESYQVNPVNHLDTQFELYNADINSGIGNNNPNEVENNNLINNQQQNIRMEISDKDKQQYQDLESKIDMILEKVMKLERIVNKEPENGGNNIHDIVLFVIFGIFVIFIMDSIYRVGKSAIL